MKKVGRILKYLADYKGKIALYFFTNILAILFGAISFSALGPFMNVLFGKTSLPTTNTSTNAGNLLQMATSYVQSIVRNEGPMNALLFICGVLITMILLKNLFLYISLYIMNPLRNAVLRRLRNDLYQKVLSLPIGFFTEERKGDLISKMTNDINEVELSIMATLEVFIREPLTILVYFASMIAISFKLTLFLIVFLPIAGFLIGRIGKSLYSSSNHIREQLGSMLSMLEETLSGMRIIKAFNAEKQMHLKYMQSNNLLFRSNNALAAKRELASPLSESMGVIVLSMVLWFGGKLIFAKEASLSPESFIVFIVLFSQIITPFKNLSTSFFNIKKGTAALDRIEALLSAPNSLTDAAEAKPIAQFEHAIEFKQVSFQYGDQVVLSDINLSIPKGKVIALVGSSGSGKSTLVDLIPRFHDVSAGQILIDGQDIRSYKMEDIRRLMGIVNQDAILFNDTIYNNIALGTGGATEAQITEAAKIANAHNFIVAKEEGYQTNVGDRGSKLSGGERQRVTIARAVLKNPSILILDEATSSLDTQSERIVQDAINQLMVNRTCIVIAHRLSTVQHADEIIVMQKGIIVQRGKHDALMQEEGLYQELVNMQQVK